MSTERKSTSRIAEYFSRRYSFFKLLLWNILFSAVLFFYYWLLVHPEYIYFQQQPSFFAEKRYILEHLQIPGGCLDILAAYLTDLFQIGWLGAVILTGLALIVLLLLRSVLRPRFWWIVSFLPIILLIMEQAKYDYLIVKTISLILALEGFLLYRDAMPQQAWIRFGISVLFTAIIYVLSPGAMFLFIFLCVLYEILNPDRKISVRIFLSLGYLFAAALLPWMGREELFLITMKNAYFRHAPLWRGDMIDTLSFTDVPLDAVLMLLILIFAGISSFPREGKNVVKQKERRFRLIQAVVAVVLTVCAGWWAINEDMKEFLEIRYAAHTGNWNCVLSHNNARTIQNSLCLFHINRALYHTGRLGSDFFSIPQNLEKPGLFLDKDTRFQCPLDYSDFCFELGFANEAKRWASEALTLYGETPEVLKRLALVNIIESEFDAAALYLGRLRQNPNCTAWAEYYLLCMVDRTKWRTETDLQKLHALVPKRDFLITSDNLKIDLEKMLSQSPNNRMAFEYLMMSYLVSRDLNRFVQTLIRFDVFTKENLPRHYQEALLIYLAQRKSADSVALENGVRESTLNDFNDFKRRFVEHGGKTETAYSDLRRSYGNTFWFYMIFFKPNS